MTTPRDEDTATPRPGAGEGEAVRREDAPAASGATSGNADEEPIDVAALQEQAGRADELLDQLQRTTADLKNLQRRSVRDRDTARRLAVRDLVQALLPSFDSLERALQSAGGGEHPEGLVEGVRLVHEEIHRVLGDRGIECVAPEDGYVDPNVHEAVVRQPTPGVPENRIVAVLEKGYVMGDLVIRPARVIVSAGEPATPEAGDDGSAGEDAPAGEG